MNLWCSASSGMLAGVGAIDFAALVTAMIIMVNVLLRLLANKINTQSHDYTEIPASYVVNIVCEHEKEAYVRALLLQGFSANSLQLNRLDSRNIDDSSRVEVLAHISANKKADERLEQIVGRMSLESSVTAAQWRIFEETEQMLW